MNNRSKSVVINTNSVIHGLQTAKKAYDNKVFIHSLSGRPLRIMAEYLEPEQRLAEGNIDKAIIFFGSARAMPKDNYEDRISNIKSRLEAVPEKEKPALEEELRKIENTKFTTDYYEDTLNLAKMIGTWSLSLPPEDQFFICTGGGPGLMEAANRGAYLAGTRSLGFNISLPFEQAPNPYISPELNFEFHYFFMRKLWFAHLAEALVVCPGGFGTMDEMWELLTLIQTGKHSDKIPVVLYNSKFWKTLINFDFLVECGMISESDLDLFTFADTPEEAFEYLKTNLSAIHHL